MNVDYYLRIVARASMLRASEQRKRAKNTLAPSAILREHGVLHLIVTNFLVKKLSQLLGGANVDSTSRSCAQGIRALYNTVFSALDMDKSGKIRQRLWKEHLQIKKLAKFESDTF